MTRFLFNPRRPLALLAVGALVIWGGCRADTSGLSTLNVDELAALHASDAAFVVCDANSEETREKNGVIPGAVLLTNYRDYETATELPADRAQQLVFYCHSPMCGAAADAARKAVAAGWQNVWVMPDGIRGWTEAGLAVERPSAG
jgi:rhodanese-related sulfurtransferase